MSHWKQIVTSLLAVLASIVLGTTAIFIINIPEGDDTRIFDIVLAEFMKTHNLRELYVEEETDLKATIDLYLERDLEQHNYSVSPELLLNFTERNEQPVSLTGYNLNLPSVMIKKFARRPLPPDEDWVKLLLPGYSHNRRTAIVRFSVKLSRSMHSSFATYLLQKEGTAWRIVWRFFSYLM